MREKVTARGFLNIKLIDRKTGKVIEERRHENDLLGDFAIGVCGELAGQANVLLGKLDYVDLYTPDAAFIKSLSPPETLEYLEYADHKEVHAVWKDKSTDSYTVGTVYMWSKYTINSTEYTRTIAVKDGLNVSKGADQVLVVDWTIAVYHAT